MIFRASPPYPTLPAPATLPGRATERPRGHNRWKQAGARGRAGGARPGSARGGRGRAGSLWWVGGAGRRETRSRRAGERRERAVRCTGPGNWGRSGGNRPRGRGNGGRAPELAPIARRERRGERDLAVPPTPREFLLLPWRPEPELERWLRRGG